ncbi:MAG: restriction endonuclease subunit S [Prevotella sp.]|nr:restriction endonuclease subunit S [Prevotella sp.]
MVEWKKLGSISDIGTGSNNREDACENGLYPFYVRSKEVLRINTFLYDEEAILIPGEGGIGEIFHYVNGKYGLHQRTYRVHPISKETKGRYLYYYLFENFGAYIEQKSYKSTAASIRKPMLLDFPVAIPTLSEQTRIVGILDTFTSAIDNLKEQIAQRRKQYEFYRDQLLDLEGKEGVEMKTLGEVCDIKGRIGFRGYTREDQVEKGEGAISLSPGNIINGIIDYNSCTYITWEKYEESPEIMTLDGDIILCKTASVGKVAMVMNLPEKATINPQLVVLKNIKIANKYLYYQLSTFKIQAILKGLAGIGSVPNISQAKLADIKICISSTDEQQRIVSILDTFEASISNLEAQLKQREKQYEYYRNKLLTFE